MATSDLSLLFRLRAQNEASPAIKATQADIAKLKTAFGQDFGQMQSIANSALSSVTTNLTRLSGNIPVVGTAVNGLASSLGTMAGESTAAAGSLAAIAGPASLAVVAVGALAAGVIALHKGLFALAESAAGFRGKLFDTSQQLGISTETLSALEILATTTGGSLDGISASLGIFQKKLEDAQDPTSKEAALLRELGVETTNTEDALRQTLAALARMPEGFKQTATALEIFGRGGKSMLAILKEMDGDLDGAIEKFRELGLIVSREDAKAADEFNDQLAILGFQVRALLGKEVIPAALEALKDFSRFLKDNKRDIDAVAKATGSLATVLGTTLKVSLAEVAGIIHAANRPFIIWADTLTRIVKALEYLKGNLPALSLLNPSAGVRGHDLQPENVGGGATDTRTHQAITQKEIEQLAALKKAQQELEEESKKRIEFVQKLAQAQKPIRDQLAGINIETHRYAVEQAILNGILKDAEPGAQAEARRIATKLDNLEKQLKLQNQLNDFLKKQEEQVRQAIEGDKGQIRIGEELIASLEKEGAVLKDVTKDRIRANAAVLASTEALKMYKETLDAILLPGEGGKGLSDDEIGGLAGAAADATAGLPPTLEGLTGVKLEAVITGIDTLRDAFAGLGQAVGEVVAAFVLYGSAGASVRQVTAQILAGVAQQAAVQAVFQLAEGFAKLAMAFFGVPNAGPSAAAHFQAAALYGAVAGIAAVAGRGIAGDSFKNGGQGGGAGGSSSGPAQPLQTIVQGRNQPQPIVIRIQGDDSKLMSFITTTVVGNYNDGGEIREVISSDGS